MNSPTKIGFIGLGLIGGSIAKAIKKYFPDYEIVAYDVNHDSLLQASQENIVDIGCKSIGSSFSDCSFIFLCAPIIKNEEALEQLLPYLDDDCIITDVGSVKSCIHETATKLGLKKNFIGGHPMTGSERSGYSASKDTLLENAYFVLTPTDEVSTDKIQKYADLVKSLKGLPLILDYSRHDQATAAISHLPQIIASSLVNFVRTNDDDEQLMKRLAAGGFKDITRIASSDPTMWQNICLMNKNSILPILDDFINILLDMRGKVNNSDADGLFDFFTHSKDYRDSITDMSSGPIRKDFSLYCDIIDEAGGIATIATILATNHINIKNIGIIHNREFEEGVLKVEFYEEPPLKKAAELLEKFHYTVYLK